MTNSRRRDPAVIDTDVYSSLLVPGSKLAGRYESLIVGRQTFISFQTEAEIRFGAQLRGWGPARVLQMETTLAAAEIVYAGPEIVDAYALLRSTCRRTGHPLAQKVHDADRWVAATALRLGLPLLTNDGIFDDVPGLRVERSAG